LLVWNDLSHLIQFARKIGYKEIKIETNGFYLDGKKISFLKHHDVLISLQILSFKEAVHDTITQAPGSFKKTMQSLHGMVEHEVRYEFRLPVMRHNGDHLQETREWFDGFDAEHVTTDVIYPKAYRDFEHVSKDYLSTFYRTSTKPFGIVKTDEFFKHAEYYPCFYGRIAVTCFGDILPCSKAREEVIGNIHDKDLLCIFRDRDMDRYWLQTKDKVEVCKDCEYRYACLDCHPIERSLCGKPICRSEL
jgi:radical SAM protein with 4Fe4S-binding SPASM domain